MKLRRQYLISEFGLEEFTQKPDFISQHMLPLLDLHRGFNDFDQTKLSQYYLYTGRGPSSASFHIGHLPALKLILEFQKAFQSRIFFMISDDEKILRDKIPTEIMLENTKITIGQLNKIGFNVDNTLFHINSDGISATHYKLLIKLMSLVNTNKLDHIFGKRANIGEYFCILYQLVPCFLSQNRQCIVICGIDQDPFFRLARKLAKKIGFKPPIVIYTKNIPGLNGIEKMSSSDPSPIPIYLSDSKKIIKEKIMKITNVGAGTLNELFEHGANIQKDIPFTLIKIFEPNTKKIALMEKAYTTGIIFGSTDYKKLITQHGKNIIVRNGKAIITTFGVRMYLVKLLHNIIRF